MLAVDTSRSMAADDVRAEPARGGAGGGARVPRARAREVPRGDRVLLDARRRSCCSPPSTGRRPRSRSASSGSARAPRSAMRSSARSRRCDPRSRPRPQAARRRPPARTTCRRRCCSSPTVRRPPARPTPAQAAGLAQRLGVPVNTVALGTAAAVVEVPLAGGLRQRVMVEPDPDTLRGIAEQTGGRFYAGARRRQPAGGVRRARLAPRLEGGEARADAGLRGGGRDSPPRRLGRCRWRGSGGRL